MIVGRSLNFSDPEQNGPVVEGQPNPMRRDVFEIPSGQSITLRVVADNPGAWILHCKTEHFDYSFFLTISLPFPPFTQVILNGILKSG
jgi:Multicopper oxidase